MASTLDWHRILVVASMVGGCARDNPLFDDGATDGLAGSTSKDDTSNTPSGSGNGSSDPGTSLTSAGTEPGTSDTVTESDVTSESDSIATSIGSSEESSAVTDTEACSEHVVDAMLDADAFLVNLDNCDECPDANYGITTEFDLFIDPSGSSYYVVHLRNLPAAETVVAATLRTTAFVASEGVDAMLEVHEFWPGCEWDEGTQNGPGGSGADGITFAHCDPENFVPLPGGSPVMAIGAAVADPVALGGELGALPLEIPLDAQQVKSWLENDGTNLVLYVAAGRGAIVKHAREATDAGGFELSFDVCE